MGSWNDSIDYINAVIISLTGCPFERTKAEVNRSMIRGELVRDKVPWLIG